MLWASLGCFKEVLRGSSKVAFPHSTPNVRHCCIGAKAFVELDKSLHHMSDPINAVMGGDNS